MLLLGLLCSVCVCVCHGRARHAETEIPLYLLPVQIWYYKTPRKTAPYRQYSFLLINMILSRCKLITGWTSLYSPESHAFLLWLPAGVFAKVAIISLSGKNNQKETFKHYCEGSQLHSFTMFVLTPLWRSKVSGPDFLLCSVSAFHRPGISQYYSFCCETYLHGDPGSTEPMSEVFSFSSWNEWHYKWSHKDIIFTCVIRYEAVEAVCVAVIFSVDLICLFDDQDKEVWN